MKTFLYWMLILISSTQLFSQQKTYTIKSELTSYIIVPFLDDYWDKGKKKQCSYPRIELEIKDRNKSYDWEKVYLNGKGSTINNGDTVVIPVKMDGSLGLKSLINKFYKEYNFSENGGEAPVQFKDKEGRIYELKDEYVGKMFEFKIKESLCDDYPVKEGFFELFSVKLIRDNAKNDKKVEISTLITQDNNEVKIGTQIWTTKNLDVSTFRNGEAIPEAKSKEEWLKAGENEQPAWCYYDNDIQNGKKYGKLYNWYAVNDSRGLAPKGYYIPSDAEWTVLTDFLGGDGKAGEKMKSKTGWASNRTSWYSKKLINCNGTNSSGFNGLPSGFLQAGASFGVGAMGGWLSSTGDSYFAVSRRLYFSRMDLTRDPCDRGGGFSVRCLRENGDNNFGSNSNHVNAQGDVKIGTQVWTSKNLDVSTFRNGEAIPEVKNRDEWIKAGENKQAAWCYYDNDVQNGKTYGKLYNWYAVNDSRGLAPKGYHIPSDAEWIVLIDFLGGHYKAGYTMKSNAGWTHKSCSGNNSSGFNGLPGGTYYQYGIFTSIRESGKWWSSKEYFDSSGYEQHFNDAVVFLIECDLSGVNYIYNKGFGLSVRCLRD